MADKPFDPNRVARLGLAAKPPHVSTRVLLLQALVSTALGAAFPRLHYRLRWVARAGPAVLLAYVLAHTEGVVGFFGASSMERLPTEIAMTENMRRFKAIPVN